MSVSFSHLHVHSEFSLLDGLSKISRLIERTKQYGQKALALTDHGAMYGAIEFYKKAIKEEIKPIIGCEVYVSADSRLDKKRQDAFHLLLLSLDNKGYENLMKIITVGQTEGFYYRPRVDKEVLSKYHQGLAVTTACPQGRVQRLLLSEGYQKAMKELQELEQIFGSENTFIELQRHPFDQYAKNDQVPDPIKKDLIRFGQESREAEEGLIKLSRELGLPLIATNDVHYVAREDAQAQDAIVCIQTGKLILDTNRLRFIDSPDFYLKSTEEMENVFIDLPEALNNTSLIADRVDISITLGAWFFPKIELPEDKTPGETLKEMAYQGARKIYQQQFDQIKDRLDYELSVIDQKGYSPYFLLYADLISQITKQGIYSNTRGSAAGSLVSYCCGITTVDPIRFNLPFERFLNPFRPSPPDIDLDVSDDRREDVINYLKDKYGQEKVAQICTFGTMKAKAAVRDVGRVLGMPYSQPDRIAKMIPLGGQGFPMTIKKAISLSHEFKKAFEAEPETQKLIDLAQKIEGNVRHLSVHAAAVVVSPDPLTKYTPLQLEPGGGKKIITQYEMHACEDVGLIKLDILGLRNLAILANSIKLVKKIKSLNIEIKDIPLDDQKTFEILSHGETFGVFQLSGTGMTRYLVDLKPERINDIMAMVALYRPGPMSFIPEYINRKHHPEKVEYFDPRMAEFLDQSYGIITYQDDVLYIAINLAGYTWEDADKFRKAIGKKIPEEMEKQHTKFVDGCVEKGMARERAEELFKQIETFAAYGFNKAHAASYGMVAYWTAYVKANYPVEFMTALLSAESGNTDKLTEAIAECEKLGIKVLPPDINESLTDFTIVPLKAEDQLPSGRAKDEGKAIR
ncbi:DNA polymerase III subunit alpha, partial [Candidatus Collierbacteria bacterium]|nr:DNA polymerase III subunit alpha [Candidatus Collierbacteria bacterium]